MPIRILLWLPVPRLEYVYLLERAHRDDGDFVAFIAERELESQKESLRLYRMPFRKEEQDRGQSPPL